MNTTQKPQKTVIPDYIGREIKIMSDIRVLGNKSAPVHYDFYLILYYRKGYGTILLDNDLLNSKEEDLFMLLPHRKIALTDASSDFSCWIICISSNYAHCIMNCNKYIDNVFGYIHDNPKCNLDNTIQGTKRTSLYLDTILDVMGIDSDYYKEDAIRHGVSTLFCNILIHTNQAENSKAYECNHVKSSCALVFRRFIQELNKDNGIHRSVKYYADLLCYTPKYLSICVSSVSGKTAHEWIDDQSIEQIKQRLRFSTLSVKEISEQLNFPNQSFFCQFVRKRLGMSPMTYRKSSGALPD